MVLPTGVGRSMLAWRHGLAGVGWPVVPGTEGGAMQIGQHGAAVVELEDAVEGLGQAAENKGEGYKQDLHARGGRRRVFSAGLVVGSSASTKQHR